MSVDTEKPSVQSATEPISQHHSNTNNNNSSSNSNHSINKSMSVDATIIISPPVPRMTTANSLTSMASPSRQTPRSQTPPPKSHPTVPESPRASYFRRIREQQERAMEKFFQTTIDAPCYALEEQIDNLTRCQQPQAFWNMFHHGSQESEDGTRDGSIPMGMYVVPQYCEYCGASKTCLCPATCQRPKLFFRKKRPPFCNQPHEWDAQTEYQLPKPKAMIPIITPELEHSDDYPKATSGNNSRKATPSPSNHWVPG